MQTAKEVAFQGRWLELCEDKGEEFARRLVQVQALLDNAREYLRPGDDSWERLVPSWAYRAWAEGSCHDEVLLCRKVFDRAVDVLRSLVDQKAEDLQHLAGDPEWCAQNAKDWGDEMAAAAVWQSFRRWQRDEIIHYVADEWILRQAREMKEVEGSRASQTSQKS